MATTSTVFSRSSPPSPVPTLKSSSGWRARKNGNEAHSRRKPADWVAACTCAARCDDGPAGRLFWFAKYGALLARLEGIYDILITADKNLRYQQNLVVVVNP